MISSATLGLTVLVIVYASFKRLTRPSLSMIRGPKSPSFIFGNLLELFQRPVGEADFAWQSLYGNVTRFKGIFGEDYLLVTDPKALQKMLNTCGYDYPKLHNIRVLLRIFFGKGIFWADGEDHKRHKRIMLPGFGPKESKDSLPIFKACAESISLKWQEAIGDCGCHSVDLNVRALLSRGTLDAIGQAAFDVQLDTIQDDSHPLAKTYKNYINDILALPSSAQIFVQAASKYIPTWLLQCIADRSSNLRIKRANDAKNTVICIAKELVREKAQALLQGKGNRDIFTLLVKANMSANAKNRLTNEELLSQVHTILIAGHESTSTTIAWILLELARNREAQLKLRDEIRKTVAAIQAHGDPQLTVPDLDGMPYLNAVIKEGLRFHPISPHTQRIPRRDDILPLSKPIITRSGDMVMEVLVPKGTHIVMSTAAYNRNKDLWGEDADVFNPNRWLDDAMDEKKSTGIGIYSNLMSFLSGTRACLGWRFALIELQVFLLEFVGKFEFKTTDAAERIVRQPALVMVPMVEGELSDGVQMPLAISLAPQDDGF